MDSIFLHGSEDVASGGRAMQNAAAEMQRTASNISAALDQHQRFMDDWLWRFQSVLEASSPNPSDQSETTGEGPHND